MRPKEVVQTKVGGVSSSADYNGVGADPGGIKSFCGQRGITPLSGTCDPKHMDEDIATMQGAFELSGSEVDAIFEVVLAGRR